MKFKKIINFIITWFLIIPLTLSVSGCSNVSNNKTSLNVINNVSDVNFTYNTSQNYCAFNQKIAKSTQFAQASLSDFIVQYYSSQTSNIDLANHKQTTAQTIYIVIIALINDDNWIGATNRFVINIVSPKTNLATITSLTDLANITVNPNNLYSSLNNTIASAKEFRTHPLIRNFIITYYNLKNEDITNQKINQSGTVYLVITAAANDANWQGSTSTKNKLAITINKNDLNSISYISDLNLQADITEKYNNLNDVIINHILDFNNCSLGDDYQITYYDKLQGGKDISNNPQVPSTNYVVITASANDPYWQGSTKYLEFTLNKINLSSVNQLTGLNFTIDSNKTYSDLDNQIVAASEFNNHPLASGYVIDYYQDRTTNNKINNQHQEQKNFYVEITAASDDPYWQGTSTRLFVKNDKKNLNVITSLIDVQMTIDSTKPFSDLDSQVLETNWFFEHPLAPGYTINYYDMDKSGACINDQKQYISASISVQITAAPNDPYWTGQTPKDSLIIDKIDLGTITTLTGFNITIDASKKYNKLDATIAAASQFTAHPLAPGYTINYYGDAQGKNNITNQLQTMKNIYVQITAGDYDPYWFLSTSLIHITLQGINLVTITSLTDSNLVISSHNSYNQLDSQLAQAQEFKDHPLAPSYRVNYYQNQSDTSLINDKTQLPGIVYVQIIAASDDPYWQGATNKIKILLNDFDLINPKILKDSTVMTTTKNGNLYIGTNDGILYKLINNKFVIASSFFAEIEALTTDDDGNLYIATANGNIYKNNYQTLYFTGSSKYGKFIKLMNFDVIGIFIGIWALSANGQLYQVSDNNQIANYNSILTPNINIKNFLICQTKDSYYFYFLNSDNQVYINEIFQSSCSLVTGIVNNEKILNITQDKAGNVYACGERGNIYKAAVSSNQFIETVSNIYNDPFIKIVIDNKNKIWATTQKGNVYYSADGGKDFTLISQISVATINNIICDQDNNIYLATTQGVYQSIINYP